jgi:4-aminobutyrate aminotransferase-like enzyme
MEEHRLPERSESLGAYFKERLVDLIARNQTLLREVRGRGLMLGLQFVRREHSLAMVYRLLARGIIVLPAGAGDVLEFVPPLIITAEQIDWAVRQIEDALQD